MERIEHNPAVWEKLFPFDLRRELAFNLTDRASFFPFVDRIVVVSQDTEGVGSEISTLFVVVSDYMTPFENDQLVKTYHDVCQGQTSIDVLGHVVVTSDSEFLMKRQVSFFRYKEATVVWERGKKPINDLDRLNLNCYLN